MACGLSEVTTEYVPLQYVSWLNMAHSLSKIVTEYGLRAVWGYNRICPAAICLLAKYGSCLVWGCDRICLAGHLRLQPNTSRCSWLNMAPGAWSPELNLITFLHCSLLYLTYTKVVKSWGDLKNAPKWYAWSLELDLITFWHCSFLYLTHIFRHCSFLYLTHTQI